MWMWLLPSALAGSLVEEMDALVLARQPSVALTCASTTAMTSLVTRVASWAPIADRLGGISALTGVAPAAMAMMGVANEGVWSVALVAGEISVDIPFSGTSAQAGLLLGSMVGDRGLRATKEGWRLSSSGLEGEARLDKGALLLDFSVGSLRLPGGPARPTLLRGLPDVDGCLVYASSSRQTGKVPVDAGVLLIPTTGDTYQLNAHSAVAPPASLRHGGGRVSELSTPTSPDLVVSTGVDLLDLVAELNEITSMGLTAEQLQDLNRANRRVSVGAGATFGVYMADKRVGGRVPLKGRLGFKLSKRKIKKGVSALDERVTWGEGGRFTMHQKGDEIVGRVRRGEVLAANDPRLLDALIAGEGTPWLSEEGAGWRASYPVVVEARGMDLLKLQPGQVMRLGLGATEDMIAMQVQLPEGYGRGMAGGESVMDRVRKGPKDLKHGVRPLQPKMELEENINGIYTAEMAYEAAFDEFVAVEPAPRRLDQLSAEPLPWPGSEGFNQLGWRPDGPVRGTWWVEVTPDGSSFTVWGAVDEDGDGVPATARRVKGGELQRMTPPEVR